MRVFDPLDRQRIFRADVEEPAVGADGVAGDEHPLDHVEGVRLQHAAVHERAGIALVGVADEIAAGSWAAAPMAHF